MRDSSAWVRANKIYKGSSIFSKRLNFSRYLHAVMGEHIYSNKHVMGSLSVHHVALRVSLWRKEDPNGSIPSAQFKDCFMIIEAK